jgi:hypothetical protein
MCMDSIRSPNNIRIGTKVMRPKESKLDLIRIGNQLASTLEVVDA